MTTDTEVEQAILDMIPANSIGELSDTALEWLALHSEDFAKNHGSVDAAAVKQCAEQHLQMRRGTQ
jgi:hypothetical protein